MRLSLLAQACSHVRAHPCLGGAIRKVPGWGKVGPVGWDGGWEGRGEEMGWEWMGRDGMGFGMAMGLDRMGWDETERILCT